MPDQLRALLDRLLCGFCFASAATGAPAPAPARRTHIPSIVHARLPPDPARPRTIVVGDLHGCLAELDALLRECSHDDRYDRVVLVGDLVNKGPSSAACVRAARKRGYYACRGNHDDAALFAWEHRQRTHSKPVPDKYAYTDSFDEADIAYLRELPYTILLEREGILIVHAGVVPGVPLHAQQPATMYTMRELVALDPSMPRPYLHAHTPTSLRCLKPEPRICRQPCCKPQPRQCCPDDAVGGTHESHRRHSLGERMAA